jgi:hypothetical protein
MLPSVVSRQVDHALRSFLTHSFEMSSPLFFVGNESGQYETAMDDTMPNGSHECTIEYIAPLDKCNREDDYNTVWAEFERRFSEGV